MKTRFIGPSRCPPLSLLTLRGRGYADGVEHQPDHHVDRGEARTRSTPLTRTVPPKETCAIGASARRVGQSRPGLDRPASQQGDRQPEDQAGEGHHPGRHLALLQGRRGPAEPEQEAEHRATEQRPPLAAGELDDDPGEGQREHARRGDEAAAQRRGGIARCAKEVAGTHDSKRHPTASTVIPPFRRAAKPPGERETPRANCCDTADLEMPSAWAMACWLSPHEGQS